MKNNCPRHIEESRKQLKTNGLKVTSARLCLLDIFKHAKKPLSIKQIICQLGDENINIVTLYRNIELLKTLGVVEEIRLRDRQAYYELKTKDHHHHLICKNCGKVRDIKNCRLAVASSKLLKTHGFAKIYDHSLEFFGVCNKCIT